MNSIMDELKMSAGRRLITLYFFIFYLIPMLGNALFHKHLYTVYKIYPFGMYAFSTLFGTYLLFLILLTFNPFQNINFPKLSQILTWIGDFYLKRRSLIIMSFFIIALINYRYGLGLNEYRYSNIRISDRHSFWFLLFMIILSTLMTVDIFYFMFVRNYNEKLSIKKYFQNILLSSSLILLASGTGSAFVAITSMVYSLFPNVFKKISFIQEGEAFNTRLFKTALGFIAIIFILMVSWSYGEKIKSVKKATLSLAGTPFISPIKGVGVGHKKSGISKMFSDMGLAEQWKSEHLYYLLERLSVYYYSFLMTSYADDKSMHFSTPIFYPVNALIFRADFVTGRNFGISRPQINSISQFNYQQLSKEKIIDTREGSSPGLLGSFNYLFVYPFNILFCVFYLCFLSAMCDTLLSQNKGCSLSWAGFLLFFSYFQLFFESPFDLISIIDSSVIYALIIVGMYIRIQVSLYKKQVESEQISPYLVTE